MNDTLFRLTDAGVTAIRWFMLCDGRAGIRFADEGAPLDLDERVFADIDAALSIASAHHVEVLFTLLDFLWCRAREIIGGVQTGGRRDVLSDPAHRAALLERIVTPILERYGREPSIMGWDIINEPEWATFGAGTWNPRASVSRDVMRAFLRDAATLIHEATTHPATVGLAGGASLDLVEGLGLDFHQVHWYDHLERLDALKGHPGRLTDRKPILLGEFPTRGSGRTTSAILSAARAAGYLGAFFWSALADDTSSDADVARVDLGAWVRSGGQPHDEEQTAHD